jgi:hypothetical protein
MDTVNTYRDVVERILGEYAAIPYRHGDLICEAIFDRERGRFMLITVGWDNGQRVHYPVIHIDLVNGKLWIQVNNTDCDIGEELVAAGVPKSDIVVAVHPPDARRHTEYAIA